MTSLIGFKLIMKCLLYMSTLTQEDMTSDTKHKAGSGIKLKSGHQVDDCNTSVLRMTCNYNSMVVRCRPRLLHYLHVYITFNVLTY